MIEAGKFDRFHQLLLIAESSFERKLSTRAVTLRTWKNKQGILTDITMPTKKTSDKLLSFASVANQLLFKIVQRLYFLQMGVWACTLQTDKRQHTRPHVRKRLLSCGDVCRPFTGGGLLSTESEIEVGKCGLIYFRVEPCRIFYAISKNALWNSLRCNFIWKKL